MSKTARKPQAQDVPPDSQFSGADYELYLVRRLSEEQALAERSGDPLERSIHLQACRYYRDMLIPAEPCDRAAADGEGRSEP